MPTEGPGSKVPPWWRRWSGLVPLLLVLVVLAFVRTAADRWASATLLAYGPRWVWLLPPAGWVALAWVRRRRIDWPALAAAGVAVFFILGFNVPQRLFSSARAVAQAEPMRIVTLNVDGARTSGDRFDEQRFVDWLDAVRPDVVALQEWTPGRRFDRPATRLTFVDAEGSLLVASRYPLRRIGYWNSRAFDGAGFILAVEVQAPTPFPVCVVHLETPRLKLDRATKGLAENYAQLRDNIALRRRVAADARGWILDHVGGPVLIVGDFNTVRDGPLYARNWSTFGNAFDEAGWGFGDTKNATWWRARIDHVLHEVNWQATRCWVGPDVGSDHYPLAAELRLTP